MPEFRDLPAREVIAAFVRAGGVVRGQGRGDHENMKMPNGWIVTIPNTRKLVKIGLLRAAIKRAGLTPAEFEPLLRGR